MEILNKLVTAQTPILSLQSSAIDFDTLEKVFRCDWKYRPSHYDSYLQMIYEKNGLWYYFKQDGNVSYPNATMDELLGSYFAKELSVPSISYEIACLDQFTWGIASLNFKKDNYDYYYMESLPNVQCCNYRETLENINELCTLCQNRKQEEVFLTHLLYLFALDIYMLQKDRCSCNLLFQIEKETKNFDLGPVHDYSNCAFSIGGRGLYLRNAISDINLHVVKMLFRNFPNFSRIFNEVFSLDMTRYIDQICDDFHFEKDSYFYENMLAYYKAKQESQRHYFKKLLK